MYGGADNRGMQHLPAMTSLLRQWLIGACWLLLACAAAGQDRAPIVLDSSDESIVLTDRALFWIEDGQALTPQDLASRRTGLPWRPLKDDSQYALNGKAFWLTFEIAPAAPGNRWFLELAVSGLDRVSLWHIDRLGRWQLQEAGDIRAVSDWPLPGRFPTLVVQPREDAPVRYWLRIEHARVTMSGAMRLIAERPLAVHRDREQFLLGAHFGLLLLVLMGALMGASLWNDRNFVVYAVYVAILGLTQAALLGVGAQYLWPDWPAWARSATFVLPPLASAAGLWFVRTVTEPRRYYEALDRLVWIAIVSLSGMAMVEAVIPSAASYQIVSLSILASMGLIVGLIALIWARGEDPGAPLLALGIAPVVVFALFPIARTLGLLPSGFLTRYGLTIGSALEAPLLLYALVIRAQRRTEGQWRAKALVTTDALTGLANRQTLRLRLESAIRRAERQGHFAALVGVGIGNLETLVKENGSDASDRAQVLAASRLRRIIGDVDLAARADTNLFFLLLEGPIREDAVREIATRIVVKGLAPSPLIASGHTLRFHVAVQMLPAAEPNADAVLDGVASEIRAIRIEDRKVIRHRGLSTAPWSTPAMMDSSPSVDTPPTRQ